MNDPAIQGPTGRYPSSGNTGIAGGMTTPSIGGGPMQPSMGGPAPYSQPGSASVMPGAGQPKLGETPAAGGGAQGPEAFGNDYQAWFNSLLQGRPFNQQALLELEPILNQYGMHLTPPNSVGERTKIQLPSGEWVRVGFGEGHPVWIPQGMAGQGGGAADRAGAAPPAGGSPYTGPGAIPPPFQAPSMEDFNAIPGLQARYQMGLQGLERGAAAKGSLLSGGTQKAINRYGQEFASGEYGNLFNQALQTYGTNFETQSRDPWRRYQDLYQGGLQAILGSKTNTPLG